MYFSFPFVSECERTHCVWISPFAVLHASQDAAAASSSSCRRSWVNSVCPLSDGGQGHRCLAVGGQKPPQGKYKYFGLATGRSDAHLIRAVHISLSARRQHSLGRHRTTNHNHNSFEWSIRTFAAIKCWVQFSQIPICASHVLFFFVIYLFSFWFWISLETLNSFAKFQLNIIAT